MIDSAKAPFPVSLLCQMLSNVRSCEPHSVTCARAKVTSAPRHGCRPRHKKYQYPMRMSLKMSRLPLLKRYYYCTGKNGFFQWEIYELSCLGFDIDFASLPLHWAGDIHVSGFQVPELPSWSPPKKKTQHASSQVQTILLATSNSGGFLLL